MSAGDKKFYNTLIDTANKQQGMLTQAQLNELDRLKTGNFDFGKRGYNKESLIQVEPKSPNTVSSINLEPVPENFRGPNAYKIKKDNEWIGDFDLEKLDDGNWGIGNVYVLDELQGKGLGKESFIQANNLLQKEGKGVLHSSGNFYGDDAKRVWESLVKEGKAEKIGEDSWRFKSAESSDPSNQIISKESAKQSSDSFADEPKKYLTDKQINEQGYKIENDTESNKRLFLNKNGNYAGQIEILTPETSSTGEKFAGVNIDIESPYRGKKLSKALYDAALDKAKEQGIDGIVSIDTMLDSPKQSKAIRKYFDGEYTSDPKLLKDIHKKIDEINEDTIRMFGKDEPLIEKPDKVYIIRGKKQATESKTKRKLSQKIQDLDSLLGEGLGYLVNNKNTQRKIDEGNSWLKNWIEHPETQAKIDTDFEYVRDRAINNPSPWGMMDAHDLAYMQAKSFEPNSKMFPLKKQFRDYGNSKSPIHSSNFGVSYLHGQDPYIRHAVNNDTYTPFERYGSWISRSPFTKDKVSTTIHEGTHDWVGDFTLKNSGQRSFIENNYTKEKLDNLRQWEDLNSKGIKPETVMGKKKAYEAYMSDPTEVHARIMELRKHFNLTPKSTQEITTEEAKKILKAIKKSKTPIDSSFADVVNNDPDKLKNLFKGLWAAPIATAGAVGTASMLANPFEGSDGLQQQKKGGATNNFIELELPKNEIQDYINQGYIVEEID
jgi:GNAT superfamily N-acetyltransferase